MIDKNQLRSTIFKHLDGLATAPVAVALSKKGILDFILQNQEVTLERLVLQFRCNEGYLNVGLRVLCSQGFLDYHVNNETQEIKFIVNSKSQTAFSLFYLYDDVVDLLHFSTQFHPRLFEEEPFKRLNLIFEKYKNNYGITFSDDTETASIQHQILKHVEGYLVGPTLVRLGMNGMFHKYFMESSFRPKNIINHLKYLLKF